MKATVGRNVLFPVLDTLLERWRAKKFPYDKKDAIIPQNVIPDDLRKDKTALAIFYFYICIYMRGGIESLQAFNAMLRMRKDHPYLFDPFLAQWLRPKDVQPILKEYVGWDSKAASINWVSNSRHLVEHWGGNPLNLIKGLRSYDEALRRMRNKGKSKEAIKKAGGPKYAGFRGFQPKMVSMLLYFYDWEGWLEVPFLYPAPADFHNFRIGLNQGAIRITHANGKPIRASETISRPWRDAVMAYLRSRKATPVEVADAIWLFSLVMCGNSPLTMTMEIETNGSGMFDADALQHDLKSEYFRNRRFRKALLNTCLKCPLLDGCKSIIPARRYYRHGILEVSPRPPVERWIGRVKPDTESRVPQKKIVVESLTLFDPDA